MFVVYDFEICVGVCLLMENVLFCVVDGDKIGFVGCNGVGKMMFIKVFVGDVLLFGGSVICFGELGYFL